MPNATPAKPLSTGRVAEIETLLWGADREGVLPPDINTAELVQAGRQLLEDRVWQEARATEQARSIRSLGADRARFENGIKGIERHCEFLQASRGFLDQNAEVARFYEWASQAAGRAAEAGNPWPYPTPTAEESAAAFAKSVHRWGELDLVKIGYYADRDDLSISATKNAARGDVVDAWNLYGMAQFTRQYNQKDYHGESPIERQRRAIHELKDTLEHVIVGDIGYPTAIAPDGHEFTLVTLNDDQMLQLDGILGRIEDFRKAVLRGESTKEKES